MKPLPPCLCGAPSVAVLWQAPIALCRVHLDAWRTSPELIQIQLITAGSDGSEEVEPAIVASLARQFEARLKEEIRRSRGVGGLFRRVLAKFTSKDSRRL